MEHNLLNEALKMPPDKRVELAQLLFESIEYEDPAIRDKWLNEVEQRMKSVKEGKSQLLDFNVIYDED